METKRLIWERMASGDTMNQIEANLDQQQHRDRATIKRVGEELLALPHELVTELPLKVQEYRKNYLNLRIYTWSRHLPPPKNRISF